MGGGVWVGLGVWWWWGALSVALPCRDFAYVARDQLTQMLKCHVFRCEAPAKDIATSLHEVCSQVSLRRPQPAAPTVGMEVGAAV